jgi:hypothetical protein
MNEQLYWYLGALCFAVAIGAVNAHQTIVAGAGVLAGVVLFAFALGAKEGR